MKKDGRRYYARNQSQLIVVWRLYFDSTNWLPVIPFLLTMFPSTASQVYMAHNISWGAVTLRVFLKPCVTVTETWTVYWMSMNGHYLCIPQMICNHFISILHIFSGILWYWLPDWESGGPCLGHNYLPGQLGGACGLRPPTASTTAICIIAADNGCACARTLPEDLKFVDIKSFHVRIWRTAYIHCKYVPDGWP